MSHWVEAKSVFELGHDDVDGSSGGVTSDQRLGQVGDHETELDQSKQNLQTRKTHLKRAKRQEITS